MFIRPIFSTILERITEPRHFIQVLIGPRQVGKTTLINQLIPKLNAKVQFASADDPTLHDHVWVEQQWQIARLMLQPDQSVILILDEIQKVAHWCSIVKKLWDEDTQHKKNLKVILLGSSPLLMQKGLIESLAGRFETIPITHWTFPEMQAAFGWTLQEYTYFGAYPGSAEWVKDETRWRRYILDSLVETTVSRDILLLTRVDKPALLRRLFMLSCNYSGQILSYQKMLGQLSDVGNTTTLAHYLQLLDGAGMVTGIEKYAGGKVRSRASSPKLMVCNTALMSAVNDYTYKAALYNRDYWGRLVESSVGAYLVNACHFTDFQLYYWREGNYEVDFVIHYHNQLLALEVKSGKKMQSLSGMALFKEAYPDAKLLAVGDNGLSLAEFFKIPLVQLMS